MGGEGRREERGGVQGVIRGRVTHRGDRVCGVCDRCSRGARGGGGKKLAGCTRQRRSLSNIPTPRRAAPHTPNTAAARG